MQQAKKVKTYDSEGKENGWLMELFKDGNLTLSYLTVAFPNAFKGFHLHRIRASNYVCLRGEMKVILYHRTGSVWTRTENLMTPGDTLHIPANIATGLENIGKEEGWLVNYPTPAYDPDLIGEQVEYTEEELEKNIIKQ